MLDEVTLRKAKAYTDAEIAKVGGGGGGGSGDVVGPSSAVDERIAVFDGTTGKLLKQASVGVSGLATSAQGAKADTAVQPWGKPPITHGNGILIPLYIYPSDAYSNATYDGLIALAKKYPDVPIYAIINPSSGPGAVADGNFTAAIQRLRGAGVHTLGYVSTAFAATAQATVETDISTWLSLYPDIAGIFLDEMKADGGTVQATLDYYHEVTNHAHSLGLYPVIANAGTALTGHYFDADYPVADNIVIHENSVYPTESYLRGNFQGGYSDYAPWLRSVLVHSQALDVDEVRMMKQYVSLIYVTDDSTGNVWDTIPAHMEELIQAVGTSNVPPQLDDTVVKGDGITDIVALTQDAYDLLTPDATTLYVITDA